MNKKYNITKKFLIKEFVKNGKSTYTIAEIVGCSYNVIRDCLILYNIPRRNYSETNKLRNENTRIKKILTKDFLQEEYVENKKSGMKIANNVGCSLATIQNYLKKFNIFSRTVSEATSKELNGNWKDGRRTIKHYCIESDCSNEICYDNWLYGKRRCGSCSHKGENHRDWKGGISSLANLIRSMKEYRDWRTQVFKRDNYQCQYCGEISQGDIEAHHKKPFANLLSEFLKEYDQFSPIEDKETLVRLAIKWKPFWEITNGKTLCEDCHKNIKQIEKSIEE